ncbi:MAG TPA: 6,7-dimethyl-8-ribityllumazine synthase [Vicinamibacterales bacterium]|nr:6,7-dimethyl-8-ribityllumazine synthase [Vicinamibacterales bacterium]
MAGHRFAIVVSRFNEEITEGLLQGARERLAEASVPDDDVTIIRVPGAFEIPIVAQRLGESGEYDAVVCLGCLIKGETMHFEYIAEAASHGIMQAAAATGIPMAFGVLTTLTEEQAVERSRSGPDNKGREAAAAALEMANLFHQLDEAIGG